MHKTTITLFVLLSLTSLNTEPILAGHLDEKTSTPQSSQNDRVSGFDHAHTLFAGVLQKHVKDGRVSYKDLKSAPEILNNYLDQMAAVQESEFQKWTGAKQLAFLINLYNASTLKLIIEHYPLRSIKDIGNILKGPWDQPCVRLFGQSVTLNHLEHNIIRKKYRDPRIHFALVCAAKGCPPLRDEPYVSERIEEQFQDQGRRFLGSPQKNSVDITRKLVYLSPIFDWFEKDFTEKSGSVLSFVQPYFPSDQSRALLKGNYGIKFTDYDWTLNDSGK